MRQRRVQVERKARRHVESETAAETARRKVSTTVAADVLSRIDRVLDGR